MEELMIVKHNDFLGQQLITLPDLFQSKLLT